MWTAGGRVRASWVVRARDAAARLTKKKITHVTVVIGYTGLVTRNTEGELDKLRRLGCRGLSVHTPQKTAAIETAKIVTSVLRK